MIGVYVSVYTWVYVYVWNLYNDGHSNVATNHENNSHTVDSFSHKITVHAVA